MYLSLYSMYVTMSISIGLYPILDLWNANTLHYITCYKISMSTGPLPSLFFNRDRLTQIFRVTICTLLYLSACT
jgi:hypothetical protein